MKTIDLYCEGLVLKGITLVNRNKEIKWVSIMKDGIEVGTIDFGLQEIHYNKKFNAYFLRERRD